MLITKEVLQSMKLSGTIIFLKKTDDQYYIICDDMKLKEYGVTIKKEYLIETTTRYDKLYAIYYLSMNDHIKTLISFLRINDSMKLRVSNRGIDDSLTLINLFVDVERLSKTGKITEYTFLIDTTIEKYL
jgi:hypothetical protein